MLQCKVRRYSLGPDRVLSASTTEIAMRNFLFGKSAFFFAIAVVSTTGLIVPARANYFSDPGAGIDLNVGSAPSPTPDELAGVYPLTSQENSEHGQVELRLSLSEKGTVRSAVVEKSSGNARLDDAAVKYAKTRWSYEPASGQETPADMTLTVKFVLQ
jgi:TonB family protein